MIHKNPDWGDTVASLPWQFHIHSLLSSEHLALGASYWAAASSLVINWPVIEQGGGQWQPEDAGVISVHRGHPWGVSPGKGCASDVISCRVSGEQPKGPSYLLGNKAPGVQEMGWFKSGTRAKHSMCQVQGPGGWAVLPPLKLKHTWCAFSCV